MWPPLDYCGGEGRYTYLPGVPTPSWVHLHPPIPIPPCIPTPQEGTWYQSGSWEPQIEIEIFADSDIWTPGTSKSHVSRSCNLLVAGVRIWIGAKYLFLYLILEVLTPPEIPTPPDRMTHTCENITFPQRLLRPVIIVHRMATVFINFFIADLKIF